MALYNRLIGTEEPKIAVHQFCAALAERTRGKVTNADISSMFNLSVDETTEFSTLYSSVSLMNAKEVEDVFMLAEKRLAYANAAAVKTRLNVISL